MPENIKQEKLIKGTIVNISDVHKFGADAIFLAHFANVKRAQNVCDFGTGCGIIPLRLFDRGHRGKCVAVDIDESAINLLKKSINENNIDNIKPICLDLRLLQPKRYVQEPIEKPQLFENTQFDVITCNPPYFTGGFVSPNKTRGNARHEQTLNINEVCRACAPLLKDGGKLCMCHRPERLADIICAMREAKIEPKCIQYITVSEKKSPWLMLIEGQKNRASGIKTLPLLITENPDGTRPSPEVKAIYEL